MITIRERVIEYLERQPDRTDWAAEVFDQIGARSWPTFCREVHRMERTDDLVLDTDEFDCTSIGLPDDDLDTPTPAPEIRARLTEETKP